MPRLYNETGFRAYIDLHSSTLKRNYKSRDWRTMEITPIQEPLVRVPRRFCFPYYHAKMKLTKVSSLYARREVYERFLIARLTLQNIDPSLDMKMLDAWRPIELQERLYWLILRKFTIRAKQFRKYNLKKIFFSSKVEDIKRVYNELPYGLRKQLEAYNRQYVSLASKGDAPSPHATGGSIDVWIYKDGKAVNMGVLFDHMHEEAGAFYHHRHRRALFYDKKGKDIDADVCYYRNVLLYVMMKAGFSAYPPEFWHFNYGNQMHMLATGEQAIYGYIEPKKKPGKRKVIAPF